MTPDALDCPHSFPQPVNKDVRRDAHTFAGCVPPRPGRGPQQITPGSRRVEPGTAEDVIEDSGLCVKRIPDRLGASSGLTLSAVLTYRSKGLFDRLSPVAP